MDCGREVAQKSSSKIIEVKIWGEREREREREVGRRKRG